MTKEKIEQHFLELAREWEGKMETSPSPRAKEYAKGLYDAYSYAASLIKDMQP